MEKPKKVLRFNDGIMTPKSDSVLLSFAKRVLIVLVIFILICSLILRENLLNEISWSAGTCLIIAFSVVIKYGGKYRAETEVEIKFYEEYLTAEWLKWKYAPNKYRKEFYKFRYDEFEECIYHTVVNKYTFYGKCEMIV